MLGQLLKVSQPHEDNPRSVTTRHAIQRAIIWQQLSISDEDKYMEGLNSNNNRGPIVANGSPN